VPFSGSCVGFANPTNDAPMRQSAAPYEQSRLVIISKYPLNC